MRLSILLFLLGTACTHLSPSDTENKIHNLEQRAQTLEQRAQTLEQRALQHEFFIAVDLCFTDYAICRVDNAASKQVCFKRHETCVVDAHRQFKGEPVRQDGEDR